MYTISLDCLLDTTPESDKQAAEMCLDFLLTSPDQDLVRIATNIKNSTGEKKLEAITELMCFAQEILPKHKLTSGLIDCIAVLFRCLEPNPPCVPIELLKLALAAAFTRGAEPTASKIESEKELSND